MMTLRSRLVRTTTTVLLARVFLHERTGAVAHLISGPSPESKCPSTMIGRPRRL